MVILFRNKLIYCTLCFNMLIITDFLILSFLAYLYDSLIIPFYQSYNSALYYSSKALQQQIRFDHVYFYIIGIIISFIQMILYQFIAYFYGLKKNLTRNFYLFYIIIPFIHFLLFILFIYSSSLKYEYMFILARILIGGFIVGLMFHLLVRYAVINNSSAVNIASLIYGKHEMC